MTSDALDLLTARLPDVARELGVSLHALRSYRTLRRSPSPGTVRALAALLRRRARQLGRMARQLEGGAR